MLRNRVTHTNVKNTCYVYKQMEAKNRILRSISPTATLRSMKPGSGIEIPCSAMSFSALIMAKARLNRQSGHNEWQVRVKNDAARGKCYLVERGLSGQGEVTTGNDPQQQPTTGNSPQQPTTGNDPQQPTTGNNAQQQDE